MTVLSFQGVSKRFDGREVIRGLTISVAEHTIYGLLGQNGAGKTTTMKMALGLLKPTDGSIFVLGEPVSYGETKTNRYVGYLPDVPAFYGYMRPAEYLALCGEVSGLDRKKVKGRSAELLTLVGLKGINRSIGGFSRGMKQRLGIAQALLNEPRLLICDEPTSALDPVGRKEILDILRSVRNKTTIVFSTHILADAERICDQVAVLRNGRLALNGSLAELKQSHRQDVISVEFAKAADLEAFLRIKSLKELQKNAKPSGNCAVMVHSSDLAQAQHSLYDAFAQTRIYPVRVEVGEPTLENLFLEAVQ